MMNYSEVISEKLHQLQIKADGWHLLVQAFAFEDESCLKGEYLQAWLKIIDCKSREIFEILKEYYELIQHTFISFRIPFGRAFASMDSDSNVIVDALTNKVNASDIAGLTMQIKNINASVNKVRGYNGPVTDEEHVALFNEEYERYKEENAVMMDACCKLDFGDIMMDNADENSAKRAFLKEKRNSLFIVAPYGKFYHDYSRDIVKLSREIVHDRNKDYLDINHFFSAYYSLHYAERLMRANITTESFQNLILNEDLLTDSIFKKIKDFITDKTLNSQRHWYIVYKVLDEKKWLQQGVTQTKFREQVNALYGKQLKVTKADFGQVESYYKNNKTVEWNVNDPTAPAQCDEYIKIAKALNNEFVNNKYLRQ